MSLSACSLLKTANNKKSPSRATASLNRHEGSQSEKAVKQQRQALAKMLKSGEAVVSKGFIIRNNQLVCGMDLRNQRNLVPGFARPAPGNFRSALAFKRGVRACNVNEKRPIAQKVSQNAFVLEGTQTAALPLVVLGAGALVGCAIGLLTNYKKAGQHPFLTTRERATKGAMAGAAAGAGSFMSLGALLGTGIAGVPIAISQVVAEALLIGGAGGASMGLLAAIWCSTAVYMIEG